MRPEGRRSRFAIPAILLVLISSIIAPRPASACPLHTSLLLPEDRPFPWLEPGLTQWFNAMVSDALGETEVTSITAGDTAVPVTGELKQIGRWLPPRPSPVMGLQMVVLPTGRVLQFSYPYFTPGSEAMVWNPGNQSFQGANWNVDIFCSGKSFLPDGRIYVTGGNDRDAVCDTKGRDYTHVFDPATSQWTRLGNMQRPRWYPSNVALGDGRTLILSGLDDACNFNRLMEIFTPGQGITRLAVDRRMELYPRIHLLPSGKVAHVGPETQTSVFDPQALGWTDVATTRLAHPRFEGTSFSLPGAPEKIMICGGFADYDRLPTATCERIDFGRANPQWQNVRSMNFPRAHPDAVTLPDGKVLIVGGGRIGLYDDPVRNAELYDPANNIWTLLPPQQYGRMYHGTAVLLPDGRVLSAGQDDSDADGDRSADWYEIYEPPYLFRGGRPQISRAPDEIGYGGAFKVESSQAADIRSVSLIALSAVTHSVNTPQRLLSLDFEGVGDRDLRIVAPEHGNLAPPGYHMLFIVNARGVPSVAKILRVASPNELPGVLEFDTSAQTFAEGSGEATITVSRLGGTAGRVRADYSVAGGSATAGTDYQPVSGTLTWNPGDAAPKSFTVPILDDFVTEDDENFDLTLTHLTGGADLGARATQIVTIADDDVGSPGDLAFTAVEFPAGEASGPVIVEVARFGGSLGPVSVSYATEGLSAAGGTDFETVGGVLSWQSGETGSKTFTIPILDDSDSEHTELVRLILTDATGGAGIGAGATAVIRLIDDDSPPGCVGNGETLCLGGGRFRVESEWRDLDDRSGDRGLGRAVPDNDQSGLFWFFDEENSELAVKVLDARTVNGFFWLFYGALSDVEYWITVTDTETGESRLYYNRPEEICGRGDVTAFAGAGSPSGAAVFSVPSSGTAPGPQLPKSQAATSPPGACAEGPENLCLLGDRFHVTVDWHDPRSGGAGTGKSLPRSDQSGLFWFFDEENFELVVKVLDARIVNERYWVFYGALSDVEYTLTVTDTESGAVKTYRNEAGNLCGRGDVDAF